MIIYRYARYHCGYEDEYETLHDAMKRAFLDHDTGEAFPKEIYDENAQKTYTNDDMYQYWKEQGWLD